MALTLTGSLKQAIFCYYKKRQEKINEQNRKRLRNIRPTLITNNCTGGFYITGSDCVFIVLL